MNRAEAIKAARDGKLIRQVSWRSAGGHVVAWVQGQWLVSKKIGVQEWLCDLPEGEYETVEELDGERHTYRMLVGAEYLHG